MIRFVKPKFNLSFGITCSCGNCNPAEFYVIPLEGLRGDNTFGFLDNQFRMVCQRCKTEFIAELKLRRFADETHRERSKGNEQKGTDGTKDSGTNSQDNES